MTKKVDYSVLRDLLHSSATSASSDSDYSDNMNLSNGKESLVLMHENLNSLYSTAWETKRATTLSSITDHDDDDDNDGDDDVDGERGSIAAKTSVNFKKDNASVYDQEEEEEEEDQQQQQQQDGQNCILDEKKIELEEKEEKDAEEHEEKEFEHNNCNGDDQDEKEPSSLTHGDCKKTATEKTVFVRGRPAACVFVASLRSNMTDDDLCISVTDHFKQWGPLATVKVLRDTSNRPYAFVQYLSEQNSKLAIKMAHNSILNGRSIRCEAAKVNRTLFFTARSFLTEDVVKRIMSRFGEIEELIPSNIRGQIFTHSPFGRGHRNWFCKFVYRDDAIKAFASLTEEGAYNVDWAKNVDGSNQRTTQFSIAHVENEHDDPDMELKVKFDKLSVFVGQLSPNVTEVELRKRFERHGEITVLNLIKKINNTFAFISFKDESSAASSVEAENHSMLCGKTMHVQYREVQMRTKSSRGAHVALAPPPINISKRSMGNNEKSRQFFSGAKTRFTNFTSSGLRGRGFRLLKGRDESENENEDGKEKEREIEKGEGMEKGGNNLPTVHDQKSGNHICQASDLSLKDVKEQKDIEKLYFASQSINSEVKVSNKKVKESFVKEERATTATSDNVNTEDYKSPLLGIGGGNRDVGTFDTAANYIAPPTSGFPLFYYVPAENVNFANANAIHPQSPPFYGIYPQYFPPQSAFDSLGLNRSTCSDFAPMANAQQQQQQQQQSPTPLPPPPHNFVMPNFIYYPNDAEVFYRNKK
ncbi:hypothetical protein PVL30_004212 [Lodderomyces elongisporus]|uniref:uncharacterized protein n=1 Tax=Lodderomyces elongisporus TaxID=36914 RepID=UPI002922D1BF|nr:uncharacterized protein PVL30_004212 [Lodderomyces elongisporus]WLF80435.1 hypothetical protein PVL30_004212 [Lodderomyces elongisporus]